MGVTGAIYDATAAAQAYLSFDYPEAKQFAKSFLTLTSAVFVASIGFAEKIVEFKTAETTAKRLIVGSWITTLGSISLCGLAIVFIFRAGLSAKYGRQDFLTLANHANILLLISGMCFALGLGALALAGAMSILRPAPARTDIANKDEAE